MFYTSIVLFFGFSTFIISSFGGTSNIRDLAIAPSNSDVLYVSRYDNSFRRTNNATSGSPTWTNLTGNSNTSIYAYFGNSDANISTDFSNPDDFLVLYYHFDNSTLYGDGSNVFDYSGRGNNGRTNREVNCRNNPGKAR